MDSFIDVIVPNYVAATVFWPRLALIVGIVVILLSFGVRELVEGHAAEQFVPSELLAFCGFLAMGAGWLYAGVIYVLFAPSPFQDSEPTFLQSLLNGPGVLFLSALVWLALCFLAALSGRTVGRTLRLWLRS